MNNHSERFTRAMRALIKGYLNGTLAKGTCAGCACGNMVAESCGYTIPIQDDGRLGRHFLKEKAMVLPHWGLAFSTSDGCQQRVDPLATLNHNVSFQIESTGYSFDELRQVEMVFEQSTKIRFTNYRLFPIEAIDEDQRNGLFAVIDLLCRFEGIEDSSSYRAAFDKSLSLEDSLVL